MASRATIVLGLMVLTTGSPALACSDTDSVLAHFNTVQQAYIEKAPDLKPEDFAIWSDALDNFGAAMGEQDFAGSCQALDDVAVKLGFDVAAAPTSSVGGGATSPEIAVTLSPTEPAATGATSPAPAGGVRHCPRARCATWRLGF